MENSQKRSSDILKITPNEQNFKRIKSEELSSDDLPERFQLRPNIIVNRKLTNEEIDLATDIISKSVADYHEISVSSQLSDSVKNTLVFISQEFLEIPYIWTYKRDFITVLSRADLWHIFNLEYDFRRFVEMKDQMISEHNSQDSYINKVLSVTKKINELHDLKLYINYQEKKKIINAQQVSPMEHKGITSKNAKYLEYIYKGLLKIVDKFGVQVPLFTKNLHLGTKSYQPINEDMAPLEIVQLFYPDSKAPDELLKQSMELLSYEISIDPMFKKFVCNHYMQHGFMVTSGPLEPISDDNECWSYCFWKVHIQKVFKIGGDFIQILHYKNQNLIDISFQLHNEGAFLETLKNNIAGDNPRSASSSYNQWNKCRTDAVLKAYNDIMANVESWLIENLKVNAEQWIMEQCMLNLEKKINVKPYRTSEMHGNAIPRVLALSLEADGCICVYVNEHSIKVQEWFWHDFNASEQEFLIILKRFKPHIIIVRCYGINSRFLFLHIKNIVHTYNGNQPQSEKLTTIFTNFEVASKVAKEEYSESSESSRYCVSSARMIQNSLMEHLRLGESIMSIEFHPLQSFLPQDKLREALDRAFVNIVNEVGVDINDVLIDKHNKPKQRALHYICGFGPQKSAKLKKLIFENIQDKPYIDSRSKLKDYLESKVFQNSAGFLRICPDPIEPLDDSRIHPNFYDLSKNSDNLHSNENLFQLVNKENNVSFADNRHDFKIPASDQIFKMLTKIRLYPGLIISIVVKKITVSCVRVCLLKNLEFECNICWNCIDMKDIKEGDIFDVVVKSLEEEDFTITLSGLSMDLKGGHTNSFYNERFDKFIDKEAKENYQLPVKALAETVLRTIAHPYFEAISAQEAEIKLYTQPIGSYIIRPTNPDKLSITWKIFDNIYRHLNITEIELEPGLEVGCKWFVEGEDEEYKTLDELLAYIQDASFFIKELIKYRKFRSTKRELDEYLEACLHKNPEYITFGFYMDNAYPGAFICGYKSAPRTQMLTMQGMFRYYGFYIEDSQFYNLDELKNGIKRKISEKCHSR